MAPAKRTRIIWDSYNASSYETVPTTLVLHLPSINAGFEHLIFGAARDSSTDR